MYSRDTERLLGQAQALIYKWQPILGLQDWQIEAKLIDEREAGEARGTCLWSEEHMRAHVSVLPPWMFCDESIGLSTLEEIVLHELLHITMRDLGEAEEHQERNLERAINQVMRALLWLQGQAGPSSTTG